MFISVLNANKRADGGFQSEVTSLFKYQMLDLGVCPVNKNKVLMLIKH